MSKEQPERQQERGQGLVEYALVLVLIAVVIILILTVLGESVIVVYAKVAGGLKGQTLQNNSVEYMFLNGAINVTSAGPGACNVSITNATVFMTEDGKLVKNSGATITVQAPGGSTTMSGTSNNVGMVTGLNATLNGVTCPGTLRIGNTGFGHPMP